MILTGAVNLEAHPTHSRLTLEDINGIYVVRELKAGVLGKDFRLQCRRPRADRRTVPAMRRRSNVPVHCPCGSRCGGC